jgi:hypothetical protein
MNCIIILAYATVAVTGLAYPGPAPTQAGHVDLAIKGLSPVPTALARRSDPVQLFRRQEDRTCGYLNQDIGKLIPICTLYLVVVSVSLSI